MSNPPFQAQLQDTLSGLNRVFQKELDSGCSIFETGKTTSTAFMSRFEGCSNLFDSFPIGDSESPSPHHFICSDKDRALILVAFCQTSLSNSNSLESDVTPAFLVARDSKQDMNVRLAAILGSIGGVAFVATIVLVFIYQYRRKRKSRLFFGKPLASVSISGPLTAPDTQLSTDEPVDWDQRVPPRRKDSLASRTSRTSRTGDEKRRDRKSVIPFSPKSFTSRKSIIQTPITSPVRSPQSVSESITSASFPKRPPRPLTYLASGPDPPNFRSRSTSNLRSPSSTNIRSPSPSSFRSPSLSNVRSPSLSNLRNPSLSNLGSPSESLSNLRSPSPTSSRSRSREPRIRTRTSPAGGTSFRPELKRSRSYGGRISSIQSPPLVSPSSPPLSSRSLPGRSRSVGARYTRSPRQTVTPLPSYKPPEPRIPSPRPAGMEYRSKWED